MSTPTSWIGCWMLFALSNACIEPVDAGASATALQSALPPLSGEPRSWSYTSLPETLCRDGSAAGVAINRSANSKNLLIYMEQGGMCIDEQSCAANPSTAALELLVLGWLLGADGVFNRDRADNPIRDWNFVYVPYCTGDLHLGDKAQADVPNVGSQQFVGYRNFTKILEHVVATFADPDAVLLAGSSAGGFGTLAHARRVQSAYPNAHFSALDDSAPPLSTAQFAECMQTRMRVLWGLEDTILADCGSACPNPRGYAQDFAVQAVASLGDVPVGLIEAAGDIDIRAVFGASKDECTHAIDTTNPAMSADELSHELSMFRTRMRAFERFGTFYPEGEVHTWLSSPDFYTITAGGVKLSEWFARLVGGQNPGQAGL